MASFHPVITRWAGLIGVNLLAACPLCSAGEIPQTISFVLRAWGTEAGLPQNTVNTIVQTRDGYLWLGTQGGLARFDGVAFSLRGLADGLPNISVRVLLEDSQGNLWIGTQGGLSRLREGRIETYSIANGLPGVNVSAISEDTSGRLWVGTSAGISLKQGDKFGLLPELASIQQIQIRGEGVLSARNGTVWIATARGLFEFKNAKLTECAGPPSDPVVLAHCMLEDRSGALWVSIGNGKVLRRYNQEWSTYNEASGLPFAYVTTMTEGNDGTIWAGSLDAGLYFLQKDRFVALRKQDGLTDDAIRSLCADREGNLWIGTRTTGLNRAARRTVTFLGAAQGLTNDFVRSVAESKDGTLWVATIGGGMYRGSPDKFISVPSVIGQITYPFMETVVATRDDSLWWGGGSVLFHWKDGTLSSRNTNNETTVLGSGNITALREDVKDGLWIGTSEGRVALLRNDQFLAPSNRVAAGGVTALAQSPDGAMWVGSTAGGLRRLAPDGLTVESVTNGLLSKQIRTMYLDKAGTLWVGTAGGGLSRLKEGKMFSFTTHQGLGDDTISQILEDNEGRLWLGCNRGIFRVAKDEFESVASGKAPLLHPRAFGLSDGMVVEECSGGSYPAGIKTRSGLLCFSTVQGVVLIDPRQQEPNTKPPKVLMEEVVVDGRGQSSERKAIIADTDATAPLTFTIPPGRRDIEFHYTGLSFSAPDKIQFRYRLENYDRDWVEARDRRIAYYPRIPPGDYVFRVLACNADNVWTDRETTLAVTVQPYFWETKLFLVSAGAGVLILAAGLVRIVERRRYKRHLAQLETQHAIERERLRISQDMHDDIGGLLTGVSILSDVGQGGTDGKSGKDLFERIGSQVRAAVVALDEIVWATNPKDDNLPRFAEYVGRFADECFENTRIRCWQEMPTEIPKLPLRADVRHNVFLAAKEALNNVLKHSGATEIWLRLKLDGDKVSLEIQDNGRGFSLDAISPDGNGLINMKTRLAECGGSAEVASSPGKGTRILLSFPMTQ